MLFPYNTHPDNLVSYRGWTIKDSDTSAADVHAAVGSPAIFRLRYTSYICAASLSIYVFNLECFPSL